MCLIEALLPLMQGNIGETIGSVTRVIDRLAVFADLAVQQFGRRWREIGQDAVATGAFEA